MLLFSISLVSYTHTLLLNYYTTDAMHAKELEFPKKLILRDGKVWESVAC